jgi:hypothetical protein
MKADDDEKDRAVAEAGSTPSTGWMQPGVHRVGHAEDRCR